MRIADIMSKKIAEVAPDAPAIHAYQQMNELKIHHLVVTEKGKIVGVVSDRDFSSGTDKMFLSANKVEDLMTPRPVTTTPHTTIRDAANLMRGRSIGCLPVLDGEKLVGIVTTTDLLELLGKGTKTFHQTDERSFQHRPQSPRKSKGAQLK